MKDFIRTESGEIKKEIVGKTISDFYTEDDMDDFITFTFTDGTQLRIRYDWIYEWEVMAKQ